MGQFLGQLGVNPTDRLENNDQRVEVLLDGAVEFAERFQNEVESQLNMLVSGITEKITEVIKTRSSRKLQRMGQNPQSQPLPGGETGKYEVSFPITTSGDSIAYTEVDKGHMTAGDFELSLMSILTAFANTTGFDVRRAIFNNENYNFFDAYEGTLAIKRLANQDTTLYNPKVGENQVSERQHYITSLFTAASISDINNPYQLIIAPLVETFGTQQGGERIMVFINKNQVELTESLTDFVELSDTAIIDAITTDRLTGLPMGHPGKLIGRIRNKCWVVQWDYMPENYMLAIHMDQEKPLVHRVYASSTGLPQGFNLTATIDEWPTTKLVWVEYGGYAVRKRLNGVMLELTADATYDIPAGYEKDN